MNVPPFIVLEIDRRDDGRVEVVYSFAPSVTYRAVLVPGTDLAAQVSKTGLTMAALYAKQGYL